MHKYIDNHWFEELSKYDGFSLIGRYVQNPKKRAIQKRLFLSNEIRNPKLEYPRLKKLDFDFFANGLKELAQKIEQNEPVKFIREAYLRCIDERLVYLSMLEATKSNNISRFNELNISEFGEPSLEIIARLIPHIKNIIDNAKASDNKISASAAVRLENTIKNIPTDYNNPLFSEFIPNHDKSVSATQIYNRFNKSLLDLNITDWNIRIDKLNLNSSIRIDHLKKTIIIPSARKTSKANLEALVSHEIGVHIMRRKNAENGCFRLLTKGLDRYIRGDEGLAKYEEYKIYPSALNSTVETYLGLALVKGINGEKMDFRDIFNVFCDYYLASRYDDVNLQSKHVVSHGWGKATRLFKGTDGQTQGVCFTKDLVYLHGYLDVLDVLKNSPQEITRFKAGKYDPSNKFHIKVINELQLLKIINTEIDDERLKISKSIVDNIG